MRTRRQDGMAALLGGAGLALLAGPLARRARQAGLHGQVAVVTGASRGLGLLLARELAGQGCRLAICARDGQELRRAQEDLEGRGAEALAVRCDVADRAQVDRLVEQTTERYGRVDVLVNNAGIIQVGPIHTVTVEDFEDALGVMFWGVVYPTLAVLPHMLAQRSGRIVNITSVGGKISAPHLLAYNCAKFAAVGFSEGLRAELAGEGIQVTTVVPGLMRTGSPLNAFFKGQREREYAWFSLGDSLPLMSMDAERAARRIVRAARRGQSELILTVPANLGTRVHGLLPGTVTTLLAAANRLLPGPGPGEATTPVRGMEIHERLHSRVLNGLTALNLAAARRLHQFPGPTEVLEDRQPPDR
jgi:short-subunit dehydrogenase